MNFYSTFMRLNNLINKNINLIYYLNKKVKRWMVYLILIGLFCNIHILIMQRIHYSIGIYKKLVRCYGWISLFLSYMLKNI
jgi:hypothetical protein